MKSKLIVLLILFCGCFNSTAQKAKTKSTVREESTKYFDAEIFSRNSILSPKDLIFPKADPPLNNDYTPMNLDKLFIESFKLYKKEFDKLPPEEEEVLLKASIVLTFNSSLKVVYFHFYYPADAWDQLPKLEKRLHRFGHSFESLNLRPYIDMSDKVHFKTAVFEWQFKLFVRYDKSGTMDYRGGDMLRILPAKK